MILEKYAINVKHRVKALGHTITKEKFKSIFRAPEDNLCSWEVNSRVIKIFS